MPEQPRRWVLDESLQQLLAFALKNLMEPKIKEWLEEVESGTIGEEARAVFYAVRWTSSPNDPRMKVVGRDDETDE